MTSGPEKSSHPQVVKRAAAAPLGDAGAAPGLATAGGLDETLVTQELRRCLSALGPGFSMTMMFSAALLIGSGVAVEWALPDFAPLPSSIAIGCFVGALTLSLFARSRFLLALTTVALRLGLSESDARRRARATLYEWNLASRDAED